MNTVNLLLVTANQINFQTGFSSYEYMMFCKLITRVRVVLGVVVIAVILLVGHCRFVYHAKVCVFSLAVS